MKMTFSLVTEWLSHRLQTQPLFCRCADDAFVSGASARVPGAFLEDWVYVLDSEDLGALRDDRPRFCILLSVGAGADSGLLSALPSDGCAAVYDLSATKAELLDHIVRAFSFYNVWHDSLLHLIRENASWFTILEELHRLLRNPIILYDRSMKVLAFTKNDGTDDLIWRDTVASGTARVETDAEAEELLRYVSRLERDDRPFRHIGEGMTDPFINCNVVGREGRCGMVTVIEHHAPLTLGQLDLLQTFSDLISIRFGSGGSERAGTQASDSQLARDLVSGAIASRERLNARLIASQWKTGSFFQLAVFLSELSFMNEMQWKQTLDDLLRCGVNGIGCVMRQENTAICLLISLPKDRPSRGVLETLDACCASRRLRCGVSNVYTDLLDSPHYLSQAAEALFLGTGRITLYEDYRFLRLIRHLKSAAYPEDMMHPAVLRLRDLDLDAGTEYLPTLRCFLRNTLNQTETARDLGIHRTTLIYRLRRISELTGLTFTDSEDLVHIAVSIEMLLSG